MNIKLAAQVLNSTVFKILFQYGPTEAYGTARFCMLMYTLFDVMNVRNIHSLEFQRKQSVMSFASIDGPRFSWFRKVFLQ